MSIPTVFPDFQDFNPATPITADFLNSLNALLRALPVSTVGDLITQLGQVVKKQTDVVSVKDFAFSGGAVGTPDPSNVVKDTAAFLAALATGKNVTIPQGTYYISQTLTLGRGQELVGAGRGKTTIIYTGSGEAIYCGAAGNVLLIYDIALRDFTLACNNKTNPVNYGIRMQNCVYFSLERLSVFGARSPNIPEPLFGTGIYLTDNSIIGRITNVSARQWNRGGQLKTLPGSASWWTAAIVIDGQGEMSTNNEGWVIGEIDDAVPTGVGVSIRDTTFQQNYNGGVIVYSGNSVLIDHNYFEGNGDVDVSIGSTQGAAPISCQVTHNNMASEGLTGSPYGDRPYSCKIRIVNGSFALVAYNNCSVSTSIPLLRIGAGAEATIVTGNRFNSSAPSDQRIVNLGSESVFTSNFPNPPGPSAAATVYVGSFTRIISDPDGSQAYTGIGFQPSSIEFLAAVDTTNEYSEGFSDGTHNRCISTDASGARTSSDYAVRLVRPVGASEAARVVAFGADGFTLNWVKSGTPTSGNALVVNYIAYR